MNHLPALRSLLCLGGTVSFLIGGNYGAIAQPETEFDPSGSPGRPSGPVLPGGAATELRVYRPPSDLKNPREDHTGGGVLGCGDEVAAIAPRLNSIGLTASTTPTFVWYNFSDDNDPIEFQLYRYEPDGSFTEIEIAQFDESQQGFMAYTLPPEAALTEGETYLWQVVLYCDSAFEQPGQYTSADIEVVELPPELASNLPTDAVERSRAYAQAGLWYDAFAEVYDAQTPEAMALREALLLDLADLEAQMDGAANVNLSEQLREIADF
ncbi:DUF928 domain-containing protein [Leptolyngbya iicbica]|uniref:DUF928 domain-containing protein n=2 Tax=Cyanophyceae TaxID=3028117 RepID=A0A4Q7E7G4_9CYAN|nr:DUF928 domain-containing protein [Leptolyngbya sp. LK]RZM76565.1 DUF928 domain-containing protein [Leptolyngbya sp. LK]